MNNFITISYRWTAIQDNEWHEHENKTIFRWYWSFPEVIAVHRAHGYITNDDMILSSFALCVLFGSIKQHVMSSVHLQHSQTHFENRNSVFCGFEFISHNVMLRSETPLILPCPFHSSCFQHRQSIYLYDVKCQVISFLFHTCILEPS